MAIGSCGHRMTPMAAGSDSPLSNRQAVQGRSREPDEDRLCRARRARCPPTDRGRLCLGPPGPRCLRAAKATCWTPRGSRISCHSGPETPLHPGIGPKGCAPTTASKRPWWAPTGAPQASRLSAARSLGQCNETSAKPSQGAGPSSCRNGRVPYGNTPRPATKAVSAVGMRNPPPGVWWFSIIAAMVRPTASALPFSVTGNSVVCWPRSRNRILARRA